MLDFLLTCTVFCITLSSLPFLLISYFALRCSKVVWLKGLSLLYPHVEFLETITIRTLLDTHRNQGIITVLLTVKGPHQADFVRRHLQDVIRKRDKLGNLVYPRLRQCLVTKCGLYAWQSGTFDLDQNLTIAASTFKARPVTDHNLQEYVCDIVSKYLPQGVPPWQIVIIPSHHQAAHYILLKIHHVLLSEGVSIGDLLPVVPPKPHHVPRETLSPLVEVLRRPLALIELQEKLTEEITNLWNEFVSNYDPLECTKLLKTVPNLFELFAIGAITLVAILRDFHRNYRNLQPTYTARWRYVLLLVRKETSSRQLDRYTIPKSFVRTFRPFAIIRFAVRCGFFFGIHVPSRILLEFVAVINCCMVAGKYCDYPYTFVGFLCNYGPLALKCTSELWYYTKLIFQAPRLIFEEILLQKESLQTITLCGRKSVAWSEPIQMTLLKRIAHVTHASCTDIVLSAVACCLARYLVSIQHLVPDCLPVSVRNVNSNYIFASEAGNDSLSGILCVNLPLLGSDVVMKRQLYVSKLRHLSNVKMTMLTTCQKQGLSHLLSLCQTKFGVLTKFLPNTIVGIYLKYLSRKYAVSITEVTDSQPYTVQKTLWGQNVEDAIFWRPPQANTCVSICLNEYNDHIRLAVMCDSQLAPNHVILVKSFVDYMHEMAQLLGVD